MGRRSEPGRPRVGRPASRRSPALHRRNAQGRPAHARGRGRRLASAAPHAAPRRGGATDAADRRRDRGDGRILLDDRTVDDETVRAIHERTDGIPLHVEELLGTLAAGPTTTVDDVRASRVPDTIEATVLERLGHRSPAARQVAAAGAVLGRRFSPATVGRILDRSEDELAEPVAELVAHAFLEELPRTGEVDFRNQLVRDAIYGAIPEGSGGGCTGSSRSSPMAAPTAPGSRPRATTSWPVGPPTPIGRRSSKRTRPLASRRTARRWSSTAERSATCRQSCRPPRGAGCSRIWGARRRPRTRPPPPPPALRRRTRPTSTPAIRLSAARVVAALAGVRHLLGDGVAAVGPGLEAELHTLEGLDGPEADRVRARLEAALAAALSRDITRPAGLAHADRAVELARRTGDVAIELDALGS